MCLQCTIHMRERITHAHHDGFRRQAREGSDEARDVKTRREAVHIALNRFVQGGRQKRLLDLHGAGGVRKDYGDKTLRAGS